MQPLNPDAHNKMTCSECGWTRDPIDHSRPYRGGHTPPGMPDDAPDCHGMLVYEEVAPFVSPGEAKQSAVSASEVASILVSEASNQSSAGTD